LPLGKSLYSDGERRVALIAQALNYLFENKVSSRKFRKAREEYRISEILNTIEHE